MAIKIKPVETDEPVSVPVTRKTKTKPPQAVSVASDDLPKKPRGFAAMSPEQRRAISERGGRALKERYAFQNRELAVAAGRSGGKISKRKKAVR
jgi:general stress protein YciG